MSTQLAQTRSALIEAERFTAQLRNELDRSKQALQQHKAKAKSTKAEVRWALSSLTAILNA